VIGQVFSLEHIATTSPNPSNAVMLFVYEKQTFTAVSFIDFVRAPVSFASRPMVIAEPQHGVPPPASPAAEQFSYPDTHRAVHQTYRLTPFQTKAARIWLLTAPTVSQGLAAEVIDAIKIHPFGEYQSISAVDTSIFFDLKPFRSFRAGLRPPSAGFRGSSPFRALSPLLPGSEKRRSHGRPSVQTTFATLAQPVDVVARANDIDQIEDRLFLGNERAARDGALLTSLGVTHVCTLNGMNAGAPAGFVYYRTSIEDSEFQELNDEFWGAVKFVEDAIANGGCVFVHCLRGVSRSAALCLAYLMQTRGLPFDAALGFLTSKRANVNINAGFQQQIKAKFGHVTPRAKGRQKMLLPGLRL
jgi:hypothetical protein